MKGRIYVIKSESAGLAYYGSTKKTLYKRLKKHRQDKVAYENGKYGYCTSFDVLEHEDHEIELMVEVEVATKKEMRELEGFYIENNHCVNKHVVGRTREETTRAYREANREKIKQHYQNNRDEIIKKSRQYYEDNRNEIVKKSRQYYEDNKNEINKKLICECGGRYRKSHKTTHLRTGKHQRFVNNKP
jgi:hypothetical protein